jgi:hypothetical protein
MDAAALRPYLLDTARTMLCPIKIGAQREDVVE